MRPGTMYKQGDIVLIPFPYSDLSENKQRPALIISNELINETEDRICCLITKNARRDDMIIKKEDFQTYIGASISNGGAGFPARTARNFTLYLEKLIAQGTRI